MSKSNSKFRIIKSIASNKEILEITNNWNFIRKSIRIIVIDNRYEDKQTSC